MTEKTPNSTDTGRCETAKHSEMPAECYFSSHTRCATCGRCYDCFSAQMKVTALNRFSPSASKGGEVKEWQLE